MFNNQTLQTLRSLKLTGMADGLEQQLTQPATHDELGFEERLALLVDRESTHHRALAWIKKRPKIRCRCCGGEMRIIKTRIPPASLPTVLVPT